MGCVVWRCDGGILRGDGGRVGRSLGQYVRKSVVDEGNGEGSVIVVIATGEPLSDRSLRGLGARAMLAIGRTGSPVTNGSGDYVIAFSTAENVRRGPNKAPLTGLANSQMSQRFQAAVEANEEAIVKALFKATTVNGNNGTVKAIDVEADKRIVETAR